MQMKSFPFFCLFLVLLHASAAFQTASQHASSLQMPSGESSSEKSLWKLLVSSDVPDAGKNRIAVQPKRKKRSQKDDYAWLNWLYRQWNDCPHGQMQVNLWKHLESSMAVYARQRTQRSANHARQLLKRCIIEYKTGNPKAILTLNLFNSAMNAHAAIGDPLGAQAILRTMNQLRQHDVSLSHIQPDIVTLTTLTLAWANSRSSPAFAKSMALLDYMETNDMNVTAFFYNTALSTLVKSSNKDLSKAQEAEKIVRRMRETGGDCQPSMLTYQLLMSIWGHCGNPEKAHEILNFVKQEQSSHDMSPNAHCYTAVINAWARSSRSGKARRAYEVLQEMRQRYVKGDEECRPNVVAYSAVINACCKAHPDDDAGLNFAIAHLVLEEMKIHSSFARPNFITYASFLQVCDECLPNDDPLKTNVLLRTFEDCCEQGQVGQIVLEKLKSAVPPDMYMEIVESKLNEWGKIPHWWRCNVKGERKSQRFFDPRGTKKQRVKF